MICVEFHNRGRQYGTGKPSRATPRAKYLIHHRRETPDKAKAMCGIHAKGYLQSVQGSAAIGREPHWIIVAIDETGRPVE